MSQKSSSRSVMLLLSLVVDVCELCRRRRKKGQHLRRRTTTVTAVEVGCYDGCGDGPHRAPSGDTLNEHEQRARNQSCDRHGCDDQILTRSNQQFEKRVPCVLEIPELFVEKVPDVLRQYQMGTPVGCSCTATVLKGRAHTTQQQTQT